LKFYVLNLTDFFNKNKKKYLGILKNRIFTIEKSGDQ